jgi:hypothetical protein
MAQGTLFDLPVILGVEKRGKHYTQPKGYAWSPGTGPEGETCGTCAFIERYRKWAKCAKNSAKHTHGRGSDILVRAPACKFWEKVDG